MRADSCICYPYCSPIAEQVQIPKLDHHVSALAHPGLPALVPVPPPEHHPAHRQLIGRGRNARGMQRGPPRDRRGGAHRDPRDLGLVSLENYFSVCFSLCPFCAVQTDIGRGFLFALLIVSPVRYKSIAQRSGSLSFAKCYLCLAEIAWLPNKAGQ